MKSAQNPQALWMGDAALRQAMRSRRAEPVLPAVAATPKPSQGVPIALRASMDVAVALGLLMAAVVAATGGRALTPHAQMAVEVTSQRLQTDAERRASVYTPDVRPDVAADAPVLVMVCDREDTLTPFWLCV